jgi:hypothetical protein
MDISLSSMTLTSCLLICNRSLDDIHVAIVLQSRCICTKGPKIVLPAHLIFFYIWLLWGKPGILKKPVVHRIFSVEGNLFIFRLLCYICSGSQKINILTAQSKRISNEQAVTISTPLDFFVHMKFSRNKNSHLKKDSYFWVKKKAKTAYLKCKFVKFLRSFYMKCFPFLLKKILMFHCYYRKKSI